MTDCIFELNFGSSTGPINAGSSSGTSYISNCQFINNGKLQSNTRRRPNGGGLCVERGHFIVEDSLFRGNITTNGGAIIALSDSSLWVNRCRFEANTANHLANDDFGDLSLLPGSPAIDAGNNSNLPIDIYDLDGDGDETDFLIGDLDLAGNSRFSDIWQVRDAHSTGQFTGAIDVGPIESQGQPCLADVNHDLRLTPADFTAWISAYRNLDLECDQNGDGWCLSSDFGAWLKNFNNGC